jgi:ATP/maltotriose-dependent transcriptional regulator MalT/DNA-binding SARP family transcriptional activator
MPRVRGALRRERLFHDLDRLARHALTWVDGPPGSGKTTLIASYLRDSSARVLWYRADQGDIDLPTIFHGLREAALVVEPGAGAKLPLLTPEYLLDVSTFARNFLRMLFLTLELPFALVFDNVQDAAEGLLETVLKLAVQELPEGGRLFAVSRAPPPPSIRALELGGHLATLDWESLRLRLDEAKAFAESVHQRDASFVASQLSQCDGWIAGFVLLLEHARRAKSAGVTVFPHTRTAIFSYFSSELLATVPGSAQHLLLCTALLPSFTLAQAAAFASLDQAAETIEYLYKRNFFIESRAGTPAIYRYHDLFREFLLERGRAAFSETERRQLLIRSARSAEESGDGDTALLLLLEAQAWGDAVPLICALAPRVLAQGRSTTLERWIASLPEAVAGAQPWVLYWQGVSRLSRDPGSTRELLSRAYHAFTAAGDPIARLLCCANIIQTFFLEWGDQHPIDEWLATYSDVLQTPGLHIPEELEVQILPQLIGAMLRHVTTPLLEHAADRARKLLAKAVQPEQIVPLAFYLAMRFEITGEWREGLPLLARLERELPPTIAPLLRLLCLGLHLTWRGMCAEYASEPEGRKLIDRYIRESEDSGIRVLDIFILGQGVYFALIWRDQDLAEQLIARMRRSLVPSRTMDLAHFSWMSALLELQRGNLASAVEHMRVSTQSAEECGTRLGLCQNRLLLAQVLHEGGDSADALRELDKAQSYAHSAGSVTLEHAALLIKAYVLLQIGREAEGIEQLRRGLLLGRSTGQSVIAPGALAKITSSLFAKALEHQIESDYVRKLIRIYRVPPPSADNPHWPWPIQIYTLGRFVLVKNGVPVRMSGKTPKKPLSLLHALIALGGRAISIDTLIRQIWGGTAAAARPSFDVALGRLRHLLSSAEALSVAGGKLTLNERICWVDSWSFERALDGIESSKPAAAGHNPLELYRGPFLAAEGDVACVAKTRDRLAAKYQRAILVVGKRHEHAGHLEAAKQIYRRGLESDNLIEELYQRLMFCEWKMGNRAEAIRVYRRCRELLSVNLRVGPSSVTQALYQQIISG